MISAGNQTTSFPQSFIDAGDSPALMRIDKNYGFEYAYGCFKFTFKNGEAEHVVYAGDGIPGTDKDGNTIVSSGCADLSASYDYGQVNFAPNGFKAGDGKITFYDQIVTNFTTEAVKYTQAFDVVFTATDGTALNTKDVHGARGYN